MLISCSSITKLTPILVARVLSLKIRSDKGRLPCLKCPYSGTLYYESQVEETIIIKSPFQPLGRHYGTCPDIVSLSLLPTVQPRVSSSLDMSTQ